MKREDLLPKDEWKTIVENMPLVSVDLIVLYDSGILLGKRNNPPAKGEWFVPGGLVKKNETLEFKKSTSEWKEVTKTVSAFSNTKGGIILIGISDAGGIKGIDIGKRSIDDLANKIKENTDPKVFPSITTEKIDGKDIVAIEVKESRSKPVFAFDRVYKRVGGSTVRASSEEIRRLALEGKKVYWDKQVCEEASLDDIDEEKVKWFLRKARMERNFDVDPGVSVKEALERLNLIKNEKLTNAAVLLFGKNPQKFFTQSEVRCARFKGTKPLKPFIDMKVFRGDIINQVDKALNFVLEHIPMAAWVVPGRVEREEKYAYPPDAVREAIINAICHRDYGSPSNVQVRVFDDRIETWNPGRLPEGWTVDTLKRKHESKPFNPLIASQFFLIRFIEKWGTGINDMMAECIEWGLPEPEFEFTGTSLIVTFVSEITEGYLREKGLNERQIKAVMHVKERGNITNREYQEINSVSRRTATSELKELVEKDVLKKIGTGKRDLKYILH